MYIYINIIMPRIMGSSHMCNTKARVAKRHYEVQWLAMVHLASLISSVLAGHHTLCQRVAILAGLVANHCTLKCHLATLALVLGYIIIIYTV